MKNDWLCFKCY